MDIEKLFRGISTDLHFESEADYKRAWQQRMPQRNLFVLAFEGGALADRLSYVFLAAYQAAVRYCFPVATDDTFYAFAASEDRSGKLPGAQIRDGRLYGSKTWIAASACVDWLIVTTAGSCLLVSANSPGVTLDHGAPKTFLPDLSQGRAHFNGADFETTEMQGEFGLAEAFFVTSAAAGFLARENFRGEDESRFQAALAQATVLETLYTAGIDSNLAQFTAVYAAIKSLGKQMASNPLNEGQAEDWQNNGRLLGMYGGRLHT